MVVSQFLSIFVSKSMVSIFHVWTQPQTHTQTVYCEVECSLFITLISIAYLARLVPVLHRGREQTIHAVLVNKSYINVAPGAYSGSILTIDNSVCIYPMTSHVKYSLFLAQWASTASVPKDNENDKRHSVINGF